MATASTIESAMTPFPYSIDADAHASSTRTMMAQLRIRHLPVREGEQLIGVLTGCDLEHAERSGVPLEPGTALRVRESYVVPVSEPLESVLSRMADHHLDVARVQHNGKLAGIFTVSDACRQHAHCLRTHLA